MAYRKIINDTNTQLLGDNFLNDTSSQYNSLSSFEVETNFTGKKTTKYENILTSFSKPINLENLSLTEEESKLVETDKNVVLNIDYSDLKSYIRFGSTLERIKAALNNIIINYPASLYVDSQNYKYDPIITIFDHEYDVYLNKTKFKIYTETIINNFGITYNLDDTEIPDNNELKNINISYPKYCVFYNNNIYKILNFTGNTTNGNYISLVVEGIPFSGETSTSLSKTFHIKPLPIEFNKFKKKLGDLEKYFLSNRLTNNSGFQFILKNPQINENGDINYIDKKIIWPTSDGYNIDYEGGAYNSFVQLLKNISYNYDNLKTDLINRYLITPSLKLYDNTNKKIEKLLRVWGREFDEIKKYVDALARINKLSYDKKDNIPDILVKNLARAFGWNDLTLLRTDQIINTFFNVEYEDNKRDLIPSEIDIELWRRILINTAYFWKTKGTRNSIISMFKLIGIPEPFIKISEYIYTVDDKIDINNVNLTLEDLPSSTLPYNEKGYPIAPKETNDFFFQISGNTDLGDTYIQNFRDVGFQLNRIVDNKKSWVYSGATEREHSSTVRYYQESSDLIINTKEVDLSLDPSQAIEYDIYDYIKNKDYPQNSSEYARPYTFININTEFEDGDNTFQIPDKPVGDIQVNLNGITLSLSGETNSGDYYIDGSDSKIIHLKSSLIKNDNREDIVVVTYLTNENGQLVENEIKYIITRVESDETGTKIILPDIPNGDVQLTINGISLSKNSSEFNFIGEYNLNPTNKQEILIINEELRSYLQEGHKIQVSYLTTETDYGLNQKILFHKVNNFSNSKFYYDSSNNKFIYKLPNKINNIENIKVTLNGITLSPNKEYQLNSINKYEIFLPPSINLGDVLGFYYVIMEDSSQELTVPDEFGVGNISELSFLEFIDLLKTKLINAKNRKVITDNNGGFYPTLLKVYVEYLKRGNLDDNNILKSNAYTHKDLFSFLNKYNSFFSSFVNQLMPATIIISGSGGSSSVGGGFEIRNTVFTRQKFTYKRGVNFNPALKWTGNDGSLFKKIQEYVEELDIKNIIIDVENTYWYNYGRCYGGVYTMKIENNENANNVTIIGYIYFDDGTEEQFEKIFNGSTLSFEEIYEGKYPTSILIYNIQPQQSEIGLYTYDDSERNIDHNPTFDYPINEIYVELTNVILEMIQNDNTTNDYELSFKVSNYINDLELMFDLYDINGFYNSYTIPNDFNLDGNTYKLQFTENDSINFSGGTISNLRRTDDNFISCIDLYVTDESHIYQYQYLDIDDANVKNIMINSNDSYYFENGNCYDLIFVLETENNNNVDIVDVSGLITFTDQSTFDFIVRMENTNNLEVERSPLSKHIDNVKITNIDVISGDTNEYIYDDTSIDISYNDTLNIAPNEEEIYIVDATMTKVNEIGGISYYDLSIELSNYIQGLIFEFDLADSNNNVVNRYSTNDLNSNGTIFTLSNIEFDNNIDFAFGNIQNLNRLEGFRTCDTTFSFENYIEPNQYDYTYNETY